MSERERRAQRLRPLFVYLEQHMIPRLALARRLGLSDLHNIYHIEKGSMLTPPDFIQRACKVLGIKPEDLGYNISVREDRRKRAS